MIQNDEIEEKAVELEVSTSDVQRDYVFGWLLSGIFNISPILKELFILKGGSAFRKCYFADARYSSDLDFSVQSEVDSEQIKTELNRVCEYVADNTGIAFNLDESRVAPKKGVDTSAKIYEARLYFKSFYGEESIVLRTKLDLTELDRIFLPVQTKPILHDYSDFDLCGGTIRCQQLEELLAAKLLALIQRIHSPDLFDFVYSVLIQNDLPIDRTLVIRTFLRKTIHEADPRIARDLLLGIPFDAFKKFWSMYLKLPKKSIVSFDDAEIKFRDIIGQLFGLVTGEAVGSAGGIFRPGYLSHFSSDSRNILMEAGRTQTIVRMVYDGLERLVEPYSLVYKIRKDGVGREYLYGVDILGGRSGKLSIKMYTQDKLASITLTDQKFEPRYDIELAKSQEQIGPEYFGRRSA